MMDLMDNFYIMAAAAASAAAAAAEEEEEEEEKEEDALRSLSSDYMSLFSAASASAADGSLLPPPPPFFSDVVFTVDGKHIHAHRCILAARSHFFRSIFCPPAAEHNRRHHHRRHLPPPPPLPPRAAAHPPPLLQIPLDGIVTYDAFLVLLRFLYSGHLLLRRLPLQPPPPHGSHSSSCATADRFRLRSPDSSVFDLALDTLHAAHFFGVNQLKLLVQKYLCGAIGKASIEEVMKVLVAGKKVQQQSEGRESMLWDSCSQFVARSGLAGETLRKNVPAEIADEIEEMRRSAAAAMAMAAAMEQQKNRSIARSGDHGHGSRIMIDRLPHSTNNSATMGGGGGASDEEFEAANHCSSMSSDTIMELQSVKKMKQALDCQDMELVKMMVMSEGLDLDASHALHYTVSHCSREVVKSLLEMGAVNVNAPDASGKTALHVACEMGSPDIVSVLLDHHASPLLQSDAGDTPLDVLRRLIAAAAAASSQSHGLRLCLELLQSAAAILQDQEHSDGVVSDAGGDATVIAAAAADDFYVVRRAFRSESLGAQASWEDSGCSVSGHGAALQNYGQYEDHESDHPMQLMDHAHFPAAADGAGGAGGYGDGADIYAADFHIPSPIPIPNSIIHYR